MKNILKKIKSLPTFWHSLFLAVAIINLSVPLFMNTFVSNLNIIEDFNDGLLSIDSQMVWNGQKLNGETETVYVSDDFAVSVLDDIPTSSNYLSFNEENMFISINDSDFSIDYGEEVTNREDLLKNIVGVLRTVLLIQAGTSFFLGILFNLIIYMVILIVARYFSKEKYRYLFITVNIPFIIFGVLTSILSLMVQSQFIIIYSLSIFAIGSTVTYLLKEQIDERNTSYFFGNEDMLNELR